MASFQAGERLSDYATVFAWKPGGGDFKVASHVEKLAASVCKQLSGAALWCGTCHDPHTNAGKSQAACLNCHGSAHRRDESCVSCHMPKARVADANHAVMTDHSIPRTPRVAAPLSAQTLVAFLGAADDRAAGLAYAELADARALRYLQRAMPQDWPVLLRLAVLEPDAVRAARLYESVLRDNPGETAALVNLGSLYAKSGRLTDAVRLWERALEANPATEEAVLNLSQIRPREDSLTILKRYLAVNPVSRKAQARLAAIEKQGR
jgi:tetratricopeptide (TPR) repeat protein